ncbi:hypothetical protein MKX03_023202 [Papaver bracteatum]|nr:hypothetical protein MKX03_023202 [Papaver bracteatum]
MEVGNDGVGVIRILNPPEKYAEAMRKNDVKAVVLNEVSLKDITLFFRDISKLLDISVQLVCSIIEDAKKPSVVVIEGLALGGGLELIMGCHARIATPKVQLGFPELTLGVLPAVFISLALFCTHQTTQRLPRLVGTAKAIEMMLTSKFITSEEGNKLVLLMHSVIHVIIGLVLDMPVYALSEKYYFTNCLDFLFLHKVPYVTDIGLKPRPVKKVAVIGGGLMGSEIATVLILSNVSVVLKEINHEYLHKGMKTIEGNLRSLVAKGKTTEDKVKKSLSILTGVLEYAEFKHVDMVIEAVIGNFPVKQSIFRELEKVCSHNCILASNTSTIDLNVIGEKTSSQEHIIGAQFLSPAHVMSLLEIVRTNKTSSQVILDLMAVGKTVKKVCVVVGNCTGFAVNRTFFPYTQGAHILANLGVDVFRIESLVSSFGMPMGPFQLQDLAGYGVAMEVGKEFSPAFPDRTFKSPLVELLVKDGRNGKNNGKGYYKYEKGCKPKPDFTNVITHAALKLTNLMPGGKPLSLSFQEIVEMIMFPVVNETCRVLDGGVVVRASDLDVASIHGMSFPSYRGGLVFWADTVGAKHIYSSLKKWSEMYGNFFRPSKFLEDRAIKGIPLNAPPPSTSQAPKSRL